MIDKLKLWIRRIKLNGFVSSALRNGIIVRNLSSSGIDRKVFIEYFDIVPTDIKDEFVSVISDLAINDKMNFELEKQSLDTSLEKIKDLIL